MKKKKSKQKLKGSESSNSSSSSEGPQEERKSHKEKRRVMEEKSKQRERHYKKVAVKKEQSSFSKNSELPSETMEKILGRSIDFAGPSTVNLWYDATCQSSSDRSYRKTARVKGRGNVPINGNKSCSEHRDSDRKRKRDRSDSSHRKKHRQYN